MASGPPIFGVERATEKSIVHLYRLGYAVEQIAQVSGRSMDAVVRIIEAEKAPVRRPKRKTEREAG